MTQRRLVNLLPEDAIRTFHRERRLLLVSRLLFAIGVFAFIFAVFAGASWQYLQILETAEAEHRLVAERSEELQRAATIELQLGELANELKVLSTLTRCQYDPALLSKDVVSLMPTGMTLDSYTITFETAKSSTGGESRSPGSSEKRAEQTIYLSGHAPTRAAVLSYQHALEALSYTALLEAPVENILKPVDTVFSFNLELKRLPAKAPCDVIEPENNASPKKTDNAT